ncbi:MAG: DUF3617 family protein [Sphingomonadales bacterium]|nr:MAG: DUF3617 family protein [Sphingomonadales bacterium]
MQRIALISLAALALAGCNGAGGGNSANAAKAEPIKRQPGSWTSKIDITKLEGADVKPGQREQMQQMFAMFSGISVCVTPEAAAQEDVSKNIESSAGARECTFDKREFNAGSMAFSGTCNRDGGKVRMTAKGTNSATAQDVTMTVEPLDAAGKVTGLMEMRVTSQRTGECTAKDFTPPAKPSPTSTAAPGPVPMPAPPAKP